MSDTDSFVYIYSAEHGAWWREQGHGYTTIKEQAGVFVRSEVAYLLGRSYADKMIRLEPASPEYSI